MEQKGDTYYTRPYKLNPRVRELLEQKIGNKGLSYAKAELIVDSVMKAKYKETLTTFNDDDKKRLMGMLKNGFSTNLPNKNIDVVVKFLTDNFTKDEIKEYIDHTLTKYKPGMVYSGVRISNHTIIYFLESMQIYPLMKGIIINKKYINDLIPFFDKDVEEFKFDEKTLMVENDYTGDMIEIFEGISIDTDVKFHNDHEIFVLATFDDNIAKNMIESFKGLEIQSIPVHMFKWEKETKEVFESGFKTEKTLEIDSIVEETVEETKTEDFEPPVPKYHMFKSEIPTDIIIIGAGAGWGTIQVTDDYECFTLIENDVVTEKYFDIDGGFDVCSLKLSKSSLKEAIEVNNELPGQTDYKIFRNFVGKIEVSASICVYGEYINGDHLKTYIPIDPKDFSSMEYLHDISQEYEEKNDADAGIDIKVFINGTWDISEPLTMDIYNTL